MSTRRYDLAFGIGAACSCSQSLRRAGLQFLSFPGDWTSPLASNPPPPNNFLRRTEQLCRGFDNFFRPGDFTYRRTLDTGMDVYVNTVTDYVFNHDFPTGVDFAVSLPKVIEKYTRRRNRLFSLIRASKTVLVVHLDFPNGLLATPPEDCVRVRDILTKEFPGVAFDILLLQCDTRLPLAQRTVESFADGCYRIAFDYRKTARLAAPEIPELDLTAEALRQFAKVRDYRTKDERKRHACAHRKAQWAKFGATSDVGYLLAKFRKSLDRRRCQIRLMARRIPAWFARKRFDQIMPLGINCDVAFRFYRKWGFVESSLFAWAASINLEHLTGTLRHFDALFAGDVELEKTSMMWKCLTDGMYIHGKLKPTEPGEIPPTADKIAADRVDTLARIRHLKEKFLRYLANDASTLFIHRLWKKDAQSDQLAARLDNLERALADLGARNWTLLVVCEREDLPRMPPGPHRQFRAVDRFNASGRVIVPEDGDPIGWDVIFTEFAPRRILPKAHAFKFE